MAVFFVSYQKEKKNFTIHSIWLRNIGTDNLLAVMKMARGVQPVYFYFPARLYFFSFISFWHGTEWAQIVIKYWQKNLRIDGWRK